MDHAKTALITGASSGLGEAYARLHASLGGNLILVARREERLLALKAELEQAHHVTVHVLAKDLAEPDAPASLFAEVERLGLPVDYLINNAGLGGQGSLAERSLEDDANLLAVDIAALTALTKLFLPRFLTRMRPPPKVGIWFRFGGKIFILHRRCFARNYILIFRRLGKCFLGT